jgi:hypothetical protein
MELEGIVQAGSRIKAWPRHGWLGLALIALFWPLNWLLPGLRTHWGFFPLWLGYSLTVDALVYRRKGHSLLSRNTLAYIGLFVISAPAWWLFEVLNWRTANWFYTGREQFSDLEYVALASLSFSTVMPAVFGSAELVSTSGWLRRLGRWPGHWPRIRPTRATTLGFFFVGWLTLALMLIWPKIFFPFIWIAPYLILAPVNVWLGNRSLSKHSAVGDWRPVIALWVGCLICGFFWEMWNFYSNPKWIYQVPYLDGLPIFEMPLAGYGGYIPFALELFALYHLALGLIGKRGLESYIQVSPAGD